MTKILVVDGGPMYGRAVENLGELIYDPSKLVTESSKIKLVLFTGGEDITPSLYGETSPLKMCWNCEERDKYEARIIETARSLGIRCIGICRGVQFINVMAGGRMYHDVTSHAGPNHEMTTPLGQTIKINSYHHQMVIPPETAELIGWSSENRSHHYYGDRDEKVEGPEKEPEAILYPNLESAGAQYHPEMMPPDTAGWKWFNNLARDLIEIENFSDIIKKYTGDKQWVAQNT